MTTNNRHQPLTAAEQEVLLPKLVDRGLEVIDPIYGFIRCPGEHHHTHETRSDHCKVYPNDGRPRLYCVHHSCKAEIDAANQKLLALHAKPTSSESSAERRERIKREVAEQKEQATFALRLKRALPDIVREHAWPHAEIATNTPTDLPPGDHWKLLLVALFGDQDVIWCGRDEKDSGPGHESRFRPVAEWKDERTCPGPLTCPHPFKPGSCSRSNDNVIEPRYLIVESDSLSKDEIGAVFRWIEVKIGLRLRAVVDTGSRSLHGWFAYPPPDLFDDLKIILPLLGCDGKMFTLSQPCRLPSHPNPKTNNMQTLLYLTGYLA